MSEPDLLIAARCYDAVQRAVATRCRARFSRDWEAIPVATRTALIALLQVDVVTQPSFAVRIGDIAYQLGVDSDDPARPWKLWRMGHREIAVIAPPGGDRVDAILAAYAEAGGDAPRDPALRARWGKLQAPLHPVPLSTPDSRTANRARATRIRSAFHARLATVVTAPLPAAVYGPTTSSDDTVPGYVRWHTDPLKGQLYAGGDGWVLRVSCQGVSLQWDGLSDALCAAYVDAVLHLAGGDPDTVAADLCRLANYYRRDAGGVHSTARAGVP